MVTASGAKRFEDGCETSRGGGGGGGNVYSAKCFGALSVSLLSLSICHCHSALGLGVYNLSLELEVAGMVAGNSPADQLPIVSIEKNTRAVLAPVRCLPTNIRVSSGVKSICDAGKASAGYF